MRASPRLPFLVLMAGLAGAAVVATLRPPAPGAGEERPAAAAGPAAAAAAPAGEQQRPRSSTWYCAAGTAGGGTDHVVVVTNPTGRTVDVDVTAFVEHDRLDERTPVPVTLAVRAGEEERVSLDDLLPDPPDGDSGDGAPAIAALVEAGEAEVLADHEVDGPHGSASGPCASRGASEWHFAWGATTRDASYVLALFNPFPSDVVVDAAFSTPGGVREPLRWQGLIVPAGEVVAVDVGQDVTRRPQVAATVRARVGSLVVERLQIRDGSLDVEGTWLALGRTDPAHRATFTGEPGQGEVVALYNPGESTADVDVVVRPHGAGEPPEPFRLVVRPGQTETLDFREESRIALDRSRRTEVTSTNGVPVVAEQVLVGDIEG